MVKLDIKNIPKVALERFFSQFDKKGVNDCWEWKGHKDKDGYGKFAYRKKGNRKFFRSHRISAAYYLGDVLDDSVVMHMCDNPSCVNPNHLKIGTHLENEQDKDRKNRRPFDHIIKYSIEDAVNVFKLVLKGYFTKQISEITGFSMPSIQNMYVDRKFSDSRYYVAFDKFSEEEKIKINNNIENKGERCTSRKLNEKDILNIRLRRLFGESYPKIEKDYPVHATQIERICKRERWKHVEDPDCYQRPVCNIYGTSFSCPEKCAGYVY